MAFLKNTFLIKKISNHTPVLLSAHRPSPALQGRKPDAADSEWGEWGHLELRPGASQREEAAPAAAAPQPPLLRRELHRSAPHSPQEALRSVPLLRDASQATRRAACELSTEAPAAASCSVGSSPGSQSRHGGGELIDQIRFTGRERGRKRERHRDSATGDECFCAAVPSLRAEY